MPVFESRNKFQKLHKNYKKFISFIIVSILSILVFFYLYYSHGIYDQIHFELILYDTVHPPSGELTDSNSSQWSSVPSNLLPLASSPTPTSRSRKLTSTPVPYGTLPSHNGAVTDPGQVHWSNTNPSSPLKYETLSPTRGGLADRSDQDLNHILLAGSSKRLARPAPTRACNMTVNPDGRLGNLMGQYATLYSLAKMNNRSACIVPQMSVWLRPYFDRLSLPNLKNLTFLVKNRQNYGLHDWMDDEYRHIPQMYPFVYLTGYPNSWTFYHHIRDEIVKEFQFSDEILAKTYEILHSFNDTSDNLTFVGVHVRRSDYVGLMSSIYRGVVAHSGFFQQAMDYFNEKYEETVFVVVSDDLEWCRNNINNSLGNVHFVGNGDLSSPAYDLALMAHCNHSIIDIGSFGFWGAYLAGGETIYLANYTLPDSSLLNVMKYNTSYLPEWIPIAADLTPIMELLNITELT